MPNIKMHATFNYFWAGVGGCLKRVRKQNTARNMVHKNLSFFALISRVLVVIYVLEFY